MLRRTCLVAPLFAVAVVVATAEPAPAQRPKEKLSHPRLRAALHEMREARQELKLAKDVWPPGYRDRALESIDSAMTSVMTILAIKDVDNFRGVDRNEDYYRRYGTYPRLRAAVQDLRDARDELRAAKADFGNLQERALDDIDIAVGHILVLVRSNNNKR